MEYGRDPRFAPPWITENEQLLADAAAQSTEKPKAATASKSKAVGSIQTIEQFEAALATAQATGRIAAVKWYAPWCRSCLAVKPLFESVAEKTAAEVADWYEVDAGASRVLIALAKIEKMPVVHLYAGSGAGAPMALASTWLIENRDAFSTFTEGLIDLHLANQRAGGIAPPPHHPRKGTRTQMATE